MSDDLMKDKNQPEPEAGTAMNIMTRRDMRQTIVKIIFVPRTGKGEPIRPRRFAFATTVLANEFIQFIKPPPGAQLGSPKQYRARVARKLMLQDPSIINRYELHCELEITGPEAAGDDTGVMIDDDNEPIDTFVEGVHTDTPEPVNAEEILEQADAGVGSDVEFPE